VQRSAAQDAAQIAPEAAADQAEAAAVEAPVAAPPAAPAEASKADAVAVVEPAAPPPVEAEAPPALPTDDRPWFDFLKLSGYAEAYYSYNFARPQNHVTNNRWLDEKHNTFTLQTVALDLDAKKGPFALKITLMFGPTADRWYFEGARIPDAESNVVLSPSGYSNETWKHIQTAYASYTAPIGDGLKLEAGLFPTAVGYEPAAVKDNFNWSRSNLFNFLPFFHVGARVSYPVTDSWTLAAAVYNGYNQATDLNAGKSMSLQSVLMGDGWFFNALYIGGPERARTDEAGTPWRNLFDAVVQVDPTAWLSLAFHGDAGFEKSDLGSHSWGALALYARAKATDWLFVALRGDGIGENVPTRGGAILLGGARHILSLTGTLELRPPGDHFSIRLEYRHDGSDSDAPLFFKRGFGADDQQLLAATQNTVTLGVTGWF
jgi:hypothetical protein